MSKSKILHLAATRKVIAIVKITTTNGISNQKHDHEYAKSHNLTNTDHEHWKPQRCESLEIKDIASCCDENHHCRCHNHDDMSIRTRNMIMSTRRIHEHWKPQRRESLESKDLVTCSTAATTTAATTTATSSNRTRNMIMSTRRITISPILIMNIENHSAVTISKSKILHLVLLQLLPLLLLLLLLPLLRESIYMLIYTI